MSFIFCLNITALFVVSGSLAPAWGDAALRVVPAAWAIVDAARTAQSLDLKSARANYRAVKRTFTILFLLPSIFERAKDNSRKA